MSRPEEELGSWHGWAHENTALFLAPMGEDDRLGLFMQQGRSTELCAVFVDPAMAQLTMDWLDDALTATGEANTKLLERLQAEQPLAFMAKPGLTPGPDLPDDTEELFDDDADTT